MDNWHFKIRDMSKHELVTLIENLVKNLSLNENFILDEIQKASHSRFY